MIFNLKTKQPEFLVKGDYVGFIAPAGRIADEEADIAIKMLRDAGFNVVVGMHVYDKYYQFAGQHNDRLLDFQYMLDAPEIKAIFIARGGYGCVHIAQNINLKKMIKQPKWLIGYSDLTIFHSILLNHQISSIHGTMGRNFYKPDGYKSFQELLSILYGQLPRYEVPSSEYNRYGETTGELVGGNLSILYSLLATPFAIEYKNRVLFIEDVGESIYHVDRMMQTFKLSGVLAKIRGLVVGSFSEMKYSTNGFGLTIEEIVLDNVGGYNYPVLFNFPAGHVVENSPLIIGKKVMLQVTNKGGVLKY